MIEKLKWDSDFFGYAVGRINIAGGKGISPEDTVESKNFRLVYLFSDHPLEVDGSDIFEVDIKITLLKKIEKNDNYPIHHAISEYGGSMDDVLKTLALESGVYSRFKRDARFLNNEFSRLYTTWITDSINKKIADKLIVFMENGKIEGFVSLKLKDTYAEIGLVAVDANSRGKGIAMELLTAAFNYTQKEGLPCLRIVTQAANAPAMQLYRKAGFEVERKKYIYHLWNNLS